MTEISQILVSSADLVTLSKSGGEKALANLVQGELVAAKVNVPFYDYTVTILDSRTIDFLEFIP